MIKEGSFSQGSNVSAIGSEVIKEVRVSLVPNHPWDWVRDALFTDKVNADTVSVAQASTTTFLLALMGRLIASCVDVIPAYKLVSDF